MATLYQRKIPVSTSKETRGRKSSEPKYKISWYIIEYYTEDAIDDEGQPKKVKKKRYIENLGDISQTQAKTRLAQYNALNKGKSKLKLTFEDAYNEFNRHYETLIGKNITQRTYDIFSLHIKKAKKYLGSVQLDELDFEAIEAFKLHLCENKKLSNRSINMHLTELKKVLEYSLDRDWIRDLPRIKRLSEAKPDYEIEYLTKEEIETLLKKAQDEQRLYLNLMIYTGMRPHEAILLTWDKINLKQGYIDVVSDNRLKTGRRIPLHSRLKEALEKADRSDIYVSPYRTADYASKAMRRLENRTGIKCNPYKLRKTFGSILAQAGANNMALATLMGHSQLQTTYQFYARLNDDNLKNDIEKF